MPDEMLVLWDYNNQKSGYTRPKDLRKAILRRYPGIKLTFRAYANKITDAELEDCTDAGADVTLVPSENGEADRIITVDLFDFVFDHPAPAFVMVISGDCDFATPLSSITALEYETVLVCHSKKAAKWLQRVVLHVLDWTTIATSGCKDMPDLPKSINNYLGRNQNSSQTAVFWNIENIRPPSNVNQKDAIQSIIEKLVKPNIKEVKTEEVKPIDFNVYGGLNFLPEDRAEGVTYHETTADPEMKAGHPDTQVMTDIMEHVCINPLASNIFIIDNNVNLIGTILWLTNRGFKVVLVGVRKQQGRVTDSASIGLERLRDAATLCLDDPVWH